MKDYGIIYGLIDPTTKKIRYIGQTRCTLKSRYQAHINEVKNPRYNTRKINWTLSLLTKGLKPEIVILEENIYKDSLDDRERFWIAKYADNDLVNASDGGKDVVCYKIREYKAKIANRLVYSYNEFTKEIIEYKNIKTAAETIDICSDNIPKAIHVKGRCKELFWAYNPDDFKSYNIAASKQTVPIIVCNDNEYMEFNSIKNAMKFLNIPKTKKNPVVERLSGVHTLDKRTGRLVWRGPYKGYYFINKADVILKLSEFLETPEEDNQNPSLESDIKYQEGSTTNE